MKHLLTFSFTALLTLGTVALAQTHTVEPVRTSGEFVKKRYSLNGSWTLSDIDGLRTLTFSPDFKTKSGPDVKLFLSPQTVAEATGKTATQDAYKLGVMKSHHGEQSYILPDDLDLSDYRSILVHCEAYSVLWGGFDIPDPADD